jgi:hypothetical protein
MKKVLFALAVIVAIAWFLLVSYLKFRVLLRWG